MTEFDLDDLLRMDTATQYRTYGEASPARSIAPNEARFKVGLEAQCAAATRIFKAAELLACSARSSATRKRDRRSAPPLLQQTTIETAAEVAAQPRRNYSPPRY